MKPFLAICACAIAAMAPALAQFYPFPTEATKLGAAGTPGDLDKQFKSLLGGPNSARFIDNAPDMRTAMVQTDGKILVGGTFRVRTSNITYTVGANQTFVANVTWRNLIRLNADGTLDTTFISPSAISAAAAVQNPNIVFGPDGAVYSILVESNDDIYQYLVAGDFLNFSHNELGNPAPRNRYLTLQTLPANPNLTPALGQNATRVANEAERLNLPDPSDPDLFAPIGTLVIQTDNGLFYRKVSQSALSTGIPNRQDWQIAPKPSEPLVGLTLSVADGDGFNGPVRKLRRLILPGSLEPFYFATGDFTSFANSPGARYITRFVLNPGGITLPSPVTQWTSTPQPDKRVWDVTALGSRIFFVGDFDKLPGQPKWSKIAAISQNGTLDPGFNPRGGFNASAMSIVADPIQNNVVVGGYFTDYDGNTVGRIARVNADGSMVPGFPAPNDGNAEGANGPIRCVTRQPDGRLLIAGEFTSYNGIKRSGIARLEADGSLDLTFVPQGVASGIQNFAFDIDGGPATASLFARPIAVGNFSRLFGSNFTGVARFIGGSFPVIWYQPNALNPPFAVTLGESKRISVVATDNFVDRSVPPFEPAQSPSEPLLYQWQKNGRNIEGEVLPYLDIESFEPGDAGKYSVQIWNSQFLIQSEPVTLAWIAFPGIPVNGLRAQGLIEANPSLNGDLGGSIVFNMTRTGLVTGTITLGNLGGRPYVAQFRGQYNYTTGLTVQIRRPNQSPLTLRLKTQFPPPEEFPFDFSGEDNSISDSFGNVAAISASAVVWSKTNPATPYAGNYNIGLETDPAGLSEMTNPDLPPELRQPLVSQGFGFLSMRITPANGQARITGLLADGTRITSSSAVRNDASGSVPLWLPLYRSQGSLVGTLSITPEVDPNGFAINPVLAELRWSKPPAVSKSPDPGGFVNIGVNSVPGSGIFNPAAVPASFNLPLEFRDGAWAETPWALPDGGFFQDFIVSQGRAVADGDNPQSVTLSFASKTGMAKGSFVSVDPVNPARRATYHALALSQSHSPDFPAPPSFFGFFILPNTAKNPDFLVGGSVFGTGF